MSRLHDTPDKLTFKSALVLQEWGCLKIVRFAAFSAHCRRRCAARDLSDALRAQAAVGQNKNVPQNPVVCHGLSYLLSPIRRPFTVDPFGVCRMVPIYTPFSDPPSSLCRVVSVLCLEVDVGACCCRSCRDSTTLSAQKCAWKRLTAARVIEGQMGNAYTSDFIDS